MNKISKISAITLVLVTTAATSASAFASRGEYNEGCERGERHGNHGMMKHKGKRGHFAGEDLDLTAEQAKTLVQARLIMRGNNRLKVGEVTQKDDDTYLIDIVTVDDSLVRQIEVDRDNGLRHGRSKSKK